jgi:hypothetical protein
MPKENTHCNVIEKGSQNRKQRYSGLTLAADKTVISLISGDTVHQKAASR